MKIEDHLKNIQESLEVIKECVQKGIVDRKRNIGFNVSVGATEMLEVFLHNLNLIGTGGIIKHEWFSSARRAEEKLNFFFPNKEKILSLLVEIESKRNLLCYGKPQPTEIIEEILKDFYELKSIFEKEGLKWN
jgi:hypothetical protein